MRLRLLAAVLLMVPVIAASAGCPSLSLFSSVHYHDVPDTRQRIELLEQRVSALEAGGARPQSPTILVPASR